MICKVDRLHSKQQNQFSALPSFPNTVEPHLSRPLTNGHFLLPGTIIGHTKFNFQFILSYTSWSVVHDLCKLCVQHPTTVFTQSAASPPSGYSRMLNAYILLICDTILL